MREYLVCGTWVIVGIAMLAVALTAGPQDSVPFAPQLTIDDFKAQLGECVVLNIRFEKQIKYTEELQAKIKELQSKLGAPPQ